MATSYTTLLGLALPVTGELSGTWGDTVNDYITQYLDAAIAGTQTISGSQTAVTLSKTTNASLGQAGSGATGSSQYQIINCTGNPGGLLTITAPAASKAYLVLNNTSTNQSVKVVGTGPTTGVTVAAARCALIAWNGSDFELVASTDITALQGTLATTNGGTGLTSFTANGVMYASSTSALTTGSALVFDGTNLGIGTSSPLVPLHVVTTATGTSMGSNVVGTFRSGAAGRAATVQLSDGTNSNYLSSLSGALGFGSGGTEYMRLDSSGNLGLGVTPSAWRSATKALQINNASFRVDTDASSFVNNAFINSSNQNVYINNGFATSYAQTSGQHLWFTAPSGTAGNAISFTQAMTLDASGNLGVGTTNPTAKLQAVGGATQGLSVTSDVTPAGFGATNGTFLLREFGGSAANNTIEINIRANSGKSGYLTFTEAAVADRWSVGVANGEGSLRFISGTPTGGSERARITSGGDLLVGTTDGSTSNKLAINGSMAFINGSSIPQINYYSSASTIEYVNRDSGGSKTFSWYYQASGAGSPATLSTSGVWTNASDARGKENISDIHYGLDTVMALQPRQYDVKSDGSHAIGFVAQEVLPVVPELVHVTRRTENDEFYGLDYGSMTAVLVKAIQELNAKVEALTAEIQTLKGN